MLGLIGGTLGSSWFPQSVRGASADAFDPTVHGFGFPNWSGTTGTDADGNEFQYEPADISHEDVETLISEHWETTLSRAMGIMLARIVYTWIGGNAATNGHCYGMVSTAESYFRDPDALPAGVESASDIPRPTDEYGAVGDRIRELQAAQLVRFEPYWFALLGLRWGLADHKASLAQITEAIDETGTAGISLDGEANAHQVLAYDYERSDDLTHVALYDPTFSAADHEGTAEPWVLSVEHDTGAVQQIRDGYADFLHHDPEMDLQMVDGLIGGHDQVLGTLSNAVFFGLTAGSTLEVDVPREVTVDRPGAEYADDGPYADAAVVLGPPDEFELSIDAPAGEAFELEVIGLREEEVVLDDIVSATVTEVPAELQFRVVDAGEAVVDVIEEVEEETAESNGNADWIEGGWWITAAVGAAGLGVVYFYLSHRSNRDGN